MSRLGETAPNTWIRQGGGASLLGAAMATRYRFETTGVGLQQTNSGRPPFVRFPPEFGKFRRAIARSLKADLRRPSAARTAIAPPAGEIQDVYAGASDEAHVYASAGRHGRIDADRGAARQEHPGLRRLGGACISTLLRQSGWRISSSRCGWRAARPYHSRSSLGSNVRHKNTPRVSNHGVNRIAFDQRNGGLCPHLWY